MSRPAVHVVNVDAPAGERWTSIVQTYKTEILAVYTKCRPLLDAVMPWTASWALMPWYKTRIKYHGEIQGISRVLGLPFIDVLAMQLVHEMHACCTSVVVAPSQSAPPVHLRTMDWDMPELKGLTIQVNFVTDNRVVANAVTWAGFVGVLTGMVPYAFSCSVNYRHAGGARSVQDLMDTRHWPVAYLLREALFQCTTYDEAIVKLTFSPILNPTYYILAGAAPMQGVVLTRNRTGADHIEYLDKKDLILIQANIDHFNPYTRADIADSKARRALIVANMTLAMHASMRVSMARVSIQSPPCRNPHTIYTTIMNPDQATIETSLT